MTGQSTTTAAVVPAACPQAAAATGVAVAEAELVLEDRFSMVPEWVLNADIGDCALRLYAVLLRYGNTTGARMPSRATLAARLHKRSVDTVDRALAELVRLGAVQVENRWAGQQRLTNRYRIRMSHPGAHDVARTSTSAGGSGGGRTDAATRTDRARGGRTSRGRMAAQIGHDREPSTETPPPPPSPTADWPPRPVGTDMGGGVGASSRPSSPARGADAVEQWRQRNKQLLAHCGIADPEAWDAYVAEVHQTRRAAGQPVTRWSSAHLLTALELAVRGRGWPAGRAIAALLEVAADPATRSPARVAEAGPWWDPPTTPHSVEPIDLSTLEAELDAVGGWRVQLQRTAREQLSAERRPVTRASVITRAVELLRNDGDKNAPRPWPDAATSSILTT